MKSSIIPSDYSWSSRIDFKKPKPTNKQNPKKTNKQNPPTPPSTRTGHGIFNIVLCNLVLEFTSICHDNKVLHLFTPPVLSLEEMHKRIRSPMEKSYRIHVSLTSRSSEDCKGNLIKLHYYSTLYIKCPNWNSTLYCDWRNFLLLDSYIPWACQ